MREQHASDIRTGLHDLLHYTSESLLSLILEDITVPTLPRRRICREASKGGNTARLDGPIAVHAIEAELGPEYADSVKNGQRAIVYRVEGS